MPGLPLLAVALALWPPAARAEQTHLLAAFDYPDAQAARAAWRAEQGPPAEIAPQAFQGRNALRLPCAFPQVEDRCYWDGEVDWNLSRATAFSLWIRVAPLSALGRFTLYLRSGEGWYGASFSVHEEGWRPIHLNKVDFGQEGTPTGWHAIDGVRLSPWKRTSASPPAVIDLAALEASTHDIVVVRGNLSMLRGSEEASGVQRFAELAVNWLAGAGLEVGLLEDTDVEQGALEAVKVAFFPHNPDLSDAELEAIRTFVDRGGRILIAYRLPEGLAPLLGVEFDRWTRAEYEGQLATLALRPGMIDGLPREVTQNSWNTIIPRPVGAQVLATWQDAGGRDSGWPAVTRNENGIFFGHALTQDDGERKAQMLLAFIAALRPDLREAISHQVLRTAGRLLGLADREAAIAFIEEQARRQRRLPGALPALRTAARRQRQAVGALEQGRFGDLLDRTRQLQAALRRAFANAFDSRTPEFRAVWCHSAFGVAGWSWAEAIARLRAHGFTAIVPNLLWGGRAYYPSDVLPVMPEVAERGDQIAECLAACRRQGIELHPWKVNWNLAGAPAEFVERLRAEGRLQSTAAGEEIVWLCPSDPRNLELERDSMLEVVRRYPVDGIHFDYIRYPHSDSCYCDGCRRRFEGQTGTGMANWPQDVARGPRREAWLQWRQDNITRLVETVSRQARRLRPGVKISAAVFSDYPNCRRTVAQDWVLWVNEGYLDFVCPMNYLADDAAFVRTVAHQLELVEGRIPLYPGIGASAPGLPPEQVIWQIHLARDARAPGFILFNYDRRVAEEHLPALRQGITR